MNGKNNLDIFEPQVEVEKTFKVFEIEAVVSAEIWLRWVFQDFFGLREINWKIARKGTAPPFGRSRENTTFCETASELIKILSWKLKTTPEIPGIFLHLAAYLFYACLAHVSANKIYWTLHKAELTAVKRPNLLDRD